MRMRGWVRVSYRDANIYFLGKYFDSLNSISINNLRGGPSFASLLIFVVFDNLDGSLTNLHLVT